MLTIISSHMNIWLILLIIGRSSAGFCNQPKFSPDHAFADISTIGSHSFDGLSALQGIFVTNNDSTRTALAAGNGTAGSDAYSLSGPNGICVDFNLNLYTADYFNNRIQFFQTGQLNEQLTTTEKVSTTATLITSSKVSISDQSCFAPIISLIPGGSSLSSPMEFKRNQDFSISSNIQLNCNNSLAIITKWTIKNCSSQIQFDSSISTLSSELYMPARTLPIGKYEITLTVTMVVSSNLTSSLSAYVAIIPSGIIVNLIQLGTSMITLGYQQNLTLNPGLYSIDLDAYIFNASDWNYEYYCRIYGVYNFPNISGILLPIDDPRIDPLNPSCLSNQSGIQYSSSKSSLTIFSKSLLHNRTYQFMVQMVNRRNASIRSTGYLLVQIDDSYHPMIIVGCVISSMCISNQEFQLVNPTTQVALFSLCVGICRSIQNIIWNVYQGYTNGSSSVVQWIQFNQAMNYQNIWFFGMNTINFTSTNQLFIENPQVKYWRFEVVYLFESETSSSSIDFILNQPPTNGSCSINPLNGTTSTSFTISCSNWFDQNGIKDYSFYIWTTDRSNLLMIGFSPTSNFDVQLPGGDDNSSMVNLIVYIRDTFECVTEYNMSPVRVIPDTAGINNLINNLQVSTSAANNNPIVQLLAGGNQNTVAQVVISLSQVFNKMNTQSLQNAVSSGVPAASISVSSLGSESSSQSNSVPLNQSVLIEFNTQANVRDYLMPFITNSIITTVNSIKLQASTLAQLTQATNQLTRTTALLASNKCYQLAIALNSMMFSISYEDVLTAATQISECTNNVMTAINGPLQQRTSVLDLDVSRANNFPDESDWSNLNLFADGNDFSTETIEKNRNLYYQKQAAQQISNEVSQTLALLTSALNIHLNIGQNMMMNSSSLFMSLETSLFESVSNKFIQQVGNSYVHIPSNLNSNAMNNQTISLRSIMQPLASGEQSKSQSNTNLSRSISFTILDQNGNEVLVEANSTNPIELIIPRDPSLIIPEMILQNVTSTPHQQLFNFHYVNIASALPISVHLEIHPLDVNIGYLLIYKFDEIPQLNQMDGWTLFCPSSPTNNTIYTYFIDNEQTLNHQSIVFGLRELNISEFCLNTSIVNPPIIDKRFNFTSNYELRTYTSGCYYLDKNNNWQSDGLKVGSLTNHYQTQCYSTHLTTFAGAFLVLPAPINWNYAFANAGFDRNKTVYLTIICVSIIYLLLIIYARYKDKKDLEKLSVMFLPDNQQSDQYLYQILVFTGQRKGAGTKSNVHFILSGDNDQTEVRTFAHSTRKVCQRGGIDSFIMTVPKSLGLLNYIRLWHDNTGRGTSASWFLKYIIVRDLQTMHKFHFIAQRWFAVEKDDGKIERVLFVASELEKQEFSYVLSKQAYQSISEGHMWFSIFSRPIADKFTRVQRCTCCFVLFFISMLLNIMYYDQTAEGNSDNLSLGPIYISSEQIIIGITVELLSLFPSLLIVQLFRRLRPRQPLLSPLEQALANHNRQSTMSKPVKSKRSKFSLPWWWIFITYGLCFLLVVLSMFFIIIRGIEFGDLKTQKWLTSVLSGFFSSIFLTQPFKVLTLAIFFAFLCRNKNEDQEAGEHMNMDHLDLSNYEEEKENQSIFTYRPVRFDRLNEAEVACARRRRLRELHMWSIIREGLTDISFLLVLSVVIYSNRNENSFYQMDHLSKFLLNTREIDNDYTQISTINEYWSWLENSFVSNIRAQQWYNNDPPRNLSGFINDKANRFIGWAIMKQTRIGNDKRSYQVGWMNETTEVSNSSIDLAFQYRIIDELDDDGGYIYEFRGRLSDLQSNLSTLHQLAWIDNKTDVVTIQMSLYNPNSQLFTSITLTTEFLSTGGVYPQALVQPFYFYFNLTSIFQLICAIFFIILIIYFLFNEIQSFLHLKSNYFRQFWSYIELGILVCSWTSVGIYVWKYQEAKRIGNLFAQTNGYVYINFQFAAYVNDLLTFFLGFCSFFGTIRLIHLLRFNQRSLVFIRTIQHASKDLISFGMMFSIIFMAFFTLFYLLFVSKLLSCSTVIQTAEMLFEMTVLKYDVHGFIEASAFLGPFTFSLFIFIVVFICLSMFISIIIDSSRHVRANTKDDDEIFSLMWNKFSHWTGLKKLSEEEIHEERDAQMRTQYINPVENFPNQIDRLLDALNRIYMSQRTDRL